MDADCSFMLLSGASLDQLNKFRVDRRIKQLELIRLIKMANGLRNPGLFDDSYSS